MSKEKKKTLRLARFLAHKSQKEVAVAIGLSTPIYLTKEWGKRLFTYSEALAVAKFLGFSISEIEFGNLILDFDAKTTDENLALIADLYKKRSLKNGTKSATMA